MRRFVGIAAIAATLLLSACDTVEGMHRDTGSSGRKAPPAHHGIR